MSKLLCQVDQAGAEALIVAWECEPGRYRDLFLNGIKPHVYMGLPFYKHWEQQYPYIHDIRTLPIPDIPKHPKWKELSGAIKDSDGNPPSSRFYYLYKQTCHSANYGIKAPTFRMNLLEKSEGEVALTSKAAELMLETYHSAFPEIRRWNARVIDIAKRTKVVYNLQGYPMQLTGYIHESMHKEILARIPQSTVATITNEAQINLQDYIENEGKDWDILNNKHDSMLAQAPEEEILELAKTMKSMIEVELTSSRGERFRMKSEVAIGRNWGKYSDKNPEGLREVKI